MTRTDADAPDPSSVPLPDGVRLGTAHGADAVLVDTPAARAVLMLDGAHLVSWIPAGEEDLLWLSPTSEFGPGVPVRGGVPLVGPWFGPGRDGAQQVKHGWLRNVRWELRAATAEGGETVLVLDSPADLPELTASLTVRLGAELSLDLEITAGGQGLELEAALHTYLAVGDVRDITISGLEGADYLDNTRGLAPAVLPAEPLRLTGATDRIVDSTATVTVTDPQRGRRLVSTARGTSRTVVWNPSDTLVTGLADVPVEAWPEFVCVEPAAAKDGFVPLAAGESHTLGVTYRIEH